MDNQRSTVDFVHTSPGTIAGQYLRMFWQPVGRSQDLSPGQAIPVRIMSEDLTLYRGEDGIAHVLESRCAHRRTQLSTGWVEGDCIRCRYHGWKYDSSGQCVEQPGEDPALAKLVRIRSYPTQEYLGLVFAYLGSGEAPELRRFPDFEKPGVLEVGPPEVWPCNYFNRIDNACDAAHVAYTHRESALRVGRTDQLKSRKMSAVETEYGVRTAVEVPGGRSMFLHFHMPNINQVRSITRVEGSKEDAARLWVDRLFWRVPIDDESSVSYVVDLMHLTGTAAEEYKARRHQARAAVTTPPNDIGEAILRGRMTVSDVDQNLSTYQLFWIEDYVVQVGQGPIADRENEHLWRSDIGVALLRKLWERELQKLSEGKELKRWVTPEGLADQSAMPKLSA